jgi:hypothetical protein
LDNCDSYHSESMKWDEAFLIKEWNCDNKLWACCRGDVSINWGDRAN